MGRRVLDSAVLLFKYMFELDSQLESVQFFQWHFWLIFVLILVSHISFSFIVITSFLIWK